MLTRVVRRELAYSGDLCRLSNDVLVHLVCTDSPLSEQVVHALLPRLPRLHTRHLLRLLRRPPGQLPRHLSDTLAIQLRQSPYATLSDHWQLSRTPHFNPSAAACTLASLSATDFVLQLEQCCAGSGGGATPASSSFRSVLEAHITARVPKLSASLLARVGRCIHGGGAPDSLTQPLRSRLQCMETRHGLSYTETLLRSRGPSHQLVFTGPHVCLSPASSVSLACGCLSALASKFEGESPSTPSDTLLLLHTLSLSPGTSTPSLLTHLESSVLHCLSQFSEPQLGAVIRFYDTRVYSRAVVAGLRSRFLADPGAWREPVLRPLIRLLGTDRACLRALGPLVARHHSLDTLSLVLEQVHRAGLDPLALLSAVETRFLHPAGVLSLRTERVLAIVSRLARFPGHAPALLRRAFFTLHSTASVPELVEFARLFLVLDVAQAPEFYTRVRQLLGVPAHAAQVSATHLVLLLSVAVDKAPDTGLVETLCGCLGGPRVLAPGDLRRCLWALAELPESSGPTSALLTQLCDQARCLPPEAWQVHLAAAVATNTPLDSTQIARLADHMQGVHPYVLSSILNRVTYARRPQTPLLVGLLRQCIAAVPDMDVYTALNLGARVTAMEFPGSSRDLLDAQLVLLRDLLSYILGQDIRACSDRDVSVLVGILTRLSPNLSRGQCRAYCRSIRAALGRARVLTQAVEDELSALEEH